MTDWYRQWYQEQERRRQEREQRRRERPLRDRLYFGEELWGASPEHLGNQSNEDRLRHFDLPLLHSEQELAAWLEIPLTRLRWFTHDRPADTVWHYVAYHVPKRSGGQRLILAPKRELKALQHHILHHLLERVPVTEVAHGFVRGRSIVSNAQPHMNKEIVLNFDLADFFPSITFPRVRGLFISLGYSFPVASVLALLCTEHEREAFDHDGKRYFISVGPRHLVQGAPTSPALANLAASRLDRRLDGLARAREFSYTRYADDLTFSGDGMAEARTLLSTVPHIVADEGFVIHEGKTRLFRRSARQVVTGLVVNEQLGTPRELRRKVRAILYNASRTGLEAQNHEGRDDFRGYLQGLIGFIHEANPDQARSLREALAAL